MAERVIVRVTFGVGDQATAFAIGAKDPDCIGESTAPGGYPKVVSINVAPCSILGFYILTVIFDDDHTRQFMVSPATLVTELGDEVPDKPRLVVARTKFDEVIN